MRLQAVGMADPQEVAGAAGVVGTVIAGVWAIAKAWPAFTRMRYESANNNGHVSILNEFKERNKQLQEMVDARDATIHQLRMENYEFRSQLATAISKIDMLTGQVAEMRTQIDRLNGGGNP